MKTLLYFCDEGTQDSNIKTILFILRTIDTEEGRLEAMVGGPNCFDPFVIGRSIIAMKYRHALVTRKLKNLHEV
jgi:hypothetical protein